MQASLSVIGFALGLLAWWQTKNHQFLIGAALLIAPWPWTLAVIRPTNNALLATDPAAAGASSRALHWRNGDGCTPCARRSAAPRRRCS